jgi:hypothetical protein
MLHLSRQINTLRQRVEDENLERRSIICKSPDNCLASTFAVPCGNFRWAVLDP